MTELHAKLSASGAHRWLNCPGSVKAEEPYEDKSSFYANEGSVAHEVAALLLDGKKESDLLGTEFKQYPGIPVTKEMIDDVNSYVDYVKSIPQDSLMIEQKVDFSNIVDDGFGTSDAIIINNETETIAIVDLKYGQGIAVDAKDNPQMVLYALGVLNTYPFIECGTITMVIVQPRLDHISEWTISIAELDHLGLRYAKQAALTLEDDAPRTPGEKQCQWCKHKAKCPELMQLTNDVLGAEFDDLENVNITSLTDAQLKKAMDNKKLIIGWLDAVNDLIFERLMDGKPFDGYKVVEGRSLRQWANEKEVEPLLIELVQDKAYTKKLLSPAQAEKILGKDKVKLKEFIIKPEGKPTLAPADDKRASITNFDADFDDL